MQTNRVYASDPPLPIVLTRPLAVRSYIWLLLFAIIRSISSIPGTGSRAIKLHKVLSGRGNVDPCAVQLRFSGREHRQDECVVGQPSNDEVESRCLDEKLVELVRRG